MSRKVAFTGIFTGIAVVLLYMGSVMPTGKLTLYFLASLPVALSIIEFGAGAGTAVYFAAAVLSAFIIGNIYGTVPFVLFFGNYPIWKYYIEKGRSVAAEVLFKLLAFNISGFLWYFLFKSLFIEMLPVQFAGNTILLICLFVALQFGFFIYDYVLSRVLFYYESKLVIFSKNNKR